MRDNLGATAPSPSFDVVPPCKYKLLHYRTLHLYQSHSPNEKHAADTPDQTADCERSDANRPGLGSHRHVCTVWIRHVHDDERPSANFGAMDGSSHLSLIIDLSPSQWHLSAQSANSIPLSFQTFLSHVLTFLNSHIAAKHENTLAVFGALPGKRCAPSHSGDLPAA